MFALRAGVAQKVAKSTANDADKAFVAIYKADEAWRRSQAGSESEEDEKAHLGPKHMPRVDAATQEAELAHWRSVLKQLDAVKVDALSRSAQNDERLNFEVFRAQIVVAENSQRFKEYERPANSDSQFWGIAPLDGHGFRNAERYRRYISVLKDVPQYFDENVTNMRAGMARGFTPPRVTLEGRDNSIAQFADAKSAEETAFWKPFEKMPDTMSDADKSALKAEAKQTIETHVVPAYKKLLAFWNGEYMPHTVTSLGAESLPDGKAYYQSLILEYATVTITPEEIHELGLKEMAGIHAEMLEQMKASGFKGTFPEFLKFLRSDPQFYVKTPQELLNDAAWIAKQFDAVAARYFGYEPRGRFGIVPVPPEIAPFYTAGRGGGSSYLLNTYDLPSRPLYSLPALTLHESAPGHSWQGSIANDQEREQKRPEFRKEYISAYGEGWALYCERLGTEMGIYKTPYERFGMLSYQAWRAARLVVDTGVHAQGWTRAQAQDYLRENTALSDHEIETEVDRYISWPGQALSYYLGEMSILKERHKAEAALGTKFNIRAFHDAVLETGSVPLPVLEEQYGCVDSRRRCRALCRNGAVNSYDGF